MTLTVWAGEAENAVQEASLPEKSVTEGEGEPAVRRPGWQRPRAGREQKRKGDCNGGWSQRPLLNLGSEKSVVSMKN